jgi:hypothetical protein
MGPAKDGVAHAWRDVSFVDMLALHVSSGPSRRERGAHGESNEIPPHGRQGRRGADREVRRPGAAG